MPVTFDLSLDDLMADQRMDISSTMNDFMSPGSTELISSSVGTPGMDYTRKRKGSATDYQWAHGVQYSIHITPNQAACEKVLRL